MPTRILAAPHQSRWLTTADVARALQLTVRGVRWLASTGRLKAEQLRSGQRIFEWREVAAVAEARARTRLGDVRMVVRAIAGEPRQLSLFGKARLKLVPDARRGDPPRGGEDLHLRRRASAGETALPGPVAKAAGMLRRSARV